MKKFILVLAITAALSGAAFSQGGPNANMGASSYYSGIAPSMSDNEALRRILYGQTHQTITIGNVGILAGSNLIGKVGIDQTTNGTTNKVFAVDGGEGWTSSHGVSGARFTSADQSGSAASVTDAPTSGQKLVITDVVISSDTQLRVDLKEETSGTVINSVYMAANSTVNLITRSKTKLATANKKLQVQTSASGNISVNAYYYSEP